MANITMAIKNFFRILLAIVCFFAAIAIATAQTPAPGQMAPRAFLPLVSVSKPARWQTTCTQAGRPFTDVVYIRGEAYVSQQTGEIYRNCVLWARVPVRADGEAGLNSLATDGVRLWAFYVDSGSLLTLSEVYPNGQVAVIHQFGPAAAEHNAAAIFYAAPDLLVGIGDNENDWSAQSATLPNGKLWAVGPSGIRVVAKGFRNPWQIGRLLGDVVISDVGNQQREEASILRPLIPGALLNYGWPCYEGTRPNAYDPESCEPLVPGVGSEKPVLEYDRSLGRGIVGTALIDGQKVYADFTGVIRTWQHQPVRQVSGYISKLTPTAMGAAVLSFAANTATLEEYKP